jgi:hypothetical protein
MRAENPSQTSPVGMYLYGPDDCARSQMLAPASAKKTILLAYFLSPR